MQMILKPVFPTQLHRDVAALIKDFFLSVSAVDTVLVVNSCARGQAVAESDLDVAVLVKPDTSILEINNIDHSWQDYLKSHPLFLKYKQSNQFAHLHLDIIDGNYVPGTLEKGEPIDYFEVEIGNQVCYAAPMDDKGSYFIELQNKWLPYYGEALRLQRLQKVVDTCNYDLNHIPFFIKRELYFQAFDILCKAFQKYLQALFIANKTYPLAYNKWIREQITEWLNKPGLYPFLSPVLSVRNIESNDVNDRAAMLRKLLKDLPNE